MLSEEQVFMGIGKEGKGEGWSYDLAEISSERDSYEFELIV